ncbi:hypothetical protein WJ971_12530 [Achromobacter xylosoxidans]
MLFGRMTPSQLTTQHGYQYLEDRAAAVAPIKANKEISQFSVICHYGVRWGCSLQTPSFGRQRSPANSPNAMPTPTISLRTPTRQRPIATMTGGESNAHLLRSEVLTLAKLF